MLFCILHFMTFSVIYSLLEFYRNKLAYERFPGRHPKRSSVIFETQIAAVVF